MADLDTRRLPRRAVQAGPVSGLRCQLWAVLMTCVAVLWSGRECSANPNLGPPYLEPGCRVTSTSWTIDCRSLADDNHCAVEVVEQVEGPCRILEKPTPPHHRFETLLLDGLAPPVDGIPVGPHVVLARGRRPFLPTVHVPASGSFGLVESPVSVRHPRLRRGRYPQTWHFVIDGRSTTRQSEDHRTRVRLLVPEGRGFSAPEVDRPMQWRREGGMWQGELQALPNSPTAVHLTIALYRSGHVVRHGGPMLAAGAAWGDGAVGLRLRAEYEGEVGGYYLPGVAVDFDAASGWQLTPRIEVSTPQVWGLPMLGLGVGAPFALDNGLHSQGLRLYGSLQLGVLGLVFGADTPLTEAGTTRYAMLLRGSM